MATTSPPPALRTLAGRYDPQIFDVGEREVRIRLEGEGSSAWDAVLRDGEVRLEAADGFDPDALLRADSVTWQRLAEDLRGGMDSFRAGRLTVRRDLHLGVGFLAATALREDTGDAGLTFRQVPTDVGEISTMQAGAGPPVVLMHGLGATKASFLPTLAALAPKHRVIAVDLPGFGDSAKPIRGAYDPPFFARTMVSLLDELGIDRAALVGNSMGGRVAIELALEHPGRVTRIALLAPSLAWLRKRPWAPLLRMVPPRLGLIQPAPRPIVEAIARRSIPGAQDGWTAAGVDEFLRSYLGARGRAAFYAAARNIYLEKPHGEGGFWTRLPALDTPSLFVWGSNDGIVPIAFREHVRKAVPSAQHLELRCGHVPQLERPRETHDAIARFLSPTS